MSTHSNVSARSVSRRRVLAGTAWATPVVLVGLAAPQAAASTGAPDACTTDDNGNVSVLTQGSWSVTSGAIATNENQTGWLGAGGFNSWDNNSSSSAPAVVTALYTFPARTGTVYSVAVKAQTGTGISSVGRARQSLNVDVVSSAGASPITAIMSSTGVPYPDERDGYTTHYNWEGEKSYAGVFAAAHSETVTVRLTFTLDPTVDVNDDIVVSGVTVVQTGCV
ncbi:hypothetical protein [Demequina sp.]|uniref:hypothetical protein n=1 Tax=Demequina sp. TaxID=2050685 RepID=UPI003A8A4BF9